MTLRDKLKFWILLSSYVEMIVRGTSPLSLPNAIADSLEYLKAFGGTEQRNLPSGYTELEYVESTGTQYIDTGVVPADKKIQANIKFKYNDLTNNMALIGQRTLSGTTEIYRFATFNDVFRFRINSDYIDTTTADTNIHIVELNGANGTIYDGTVLSSTQYTTPSTGTNQIRLFGINDAQATSPNLNGRVYYCKMFADDVLIRNFIPAKNASGVVGMYDTVSQTFFTNAGTGTFTAGADAVPTPDTPMDIVSNNGVLKARHQSGLPLGYTLLDYIESTGTQYIDTGIVPTNADNTRVKFRFALNDTTNGENQSIGSNSNLNMYATSVTFKFRANGIEIKDFDTDWHAVEMSKSSAGKETIFDGVTYTTPATTEEPNNFYLFALKAVNNVYFGKQKLSYAEVYQSGALVRNLIPCKNSSNVIGMYDTVTGQFFTNAGTGTFVAGNPVDDLEVYTDGTVETINVHGKNLYNDATKTDGVILSDTGGEIVSELGSLSDYIKVKPNTTYTLSLIRTQSSIYTRICTYSADKTFIDLKVKDTDTSAGDRTYTFTTEATAEYVRFCFKTDSTNIQLEQGSTATTYEPYYNGGSLECPMLLSVGG